MIALSRFTCLLVYLSITPCLAMQKQGRTISIGEAGGIQSLCTAKNGASEICIIGHAFSESFEIGHLSTADEITKGLIRPLLDIWAASTSPIALMILNSEATCAQDAQTAQGPMRDAAFHFPLRAALSAFAAQTCFHHNNLRFVCTPPFERFEEYQWDPAFIFGMATFPHLAEKAKLSFTDIRSMDRELSRLNHSARKRFFQKNNPFEAFIQEVQASFIQDRTALTKPLLTIKQYSELLTFAIKKCKECVKSLTSDTLKKRAQALVIQLELTQQHAESYFAAYGINKEGTLVEALLEVIKNKQTINLSTEEFMRELLTPLITCRDLIIHTGLVNQAPIHPRIVLIYPYEKVYNLLVFLKEEGYEISYKGFTPNITQTKVVALGKSPFSVVETTTYLRSRFGMTGSEEVIAFAEGASLMSFDHPKGNTKSLGFLLAEIANLSLNSPEPSLENPIFEFTGTKEEVATRQCAICKTLFILRSEEPEQAALCSSVCLLKHEIQQKCPKLAELLQKKSPSKRDRLIRKQLSALSYLWFLALSPMVHLPDNSLHRFSLESLLARLELSEHDTNKDSSWPTTLTYAKLLGIDSTLLKAFMKRYACEKERYAHQLAKYAGQRSKKGADNGFAPEFDEEGIINRAQQELYGNLRLMFPKTSSDLFFLQLYYALAKRLSQELKTTQQELEEILFVPSTRPQGSQKASIDKTLAYINNTKKK